jgi:hypothetical protein
LNHGGLAESNAVRPVLAALTDMSGHQPADNPWRNCRK